MTERGKYLNVNEGAKAEFERTPAFDKILSFNFFQLFPI
jgi:hypothetical protein